MADDASGHGFAGTGAAASDAVVVDCYNRTRRSYIHVRQSCITPIKDGGVLVFLDSPCASRGSGPSVGWWLASGATRACSEPSNRPGRLARGHRHWAAPVQPPPARDGLAGPVCRRLCPRRLIRSLQLARAVRAPPSRPFLGGVRRGLLGDAPSRPICPDGSDPGDPARRSMTGGPHARTGWFGHYIRRVRCARLCRLCSAATVRACGAPFCAGSCDAYIPAGPVWLDQSGRAGRTSQFRAGACPVAARADGSVAGSLGPVGCQCCVRSAGSRVGADRQHRSPHAGLFWPVGLFHSREPARQVCPLRGWTDGTRLM